jgi:hypothetical protein
MIDALSALVENYSSDNEYEGVDRRFLEEKLHVSDDVFMFDVAAAAEPKRTKVFSNELQILNYFLSPAKQPSAEEKVNYAINSDKSKSISPKGHLSVWKDHTSENKVRRKLEQQARRDTANAALLARIESTCREYIAKLNKASENAVDIEAAAVEDADKELTKPKKEGKLAASRRTKWTHDQRQYIWTSFKDFHRLSATENGDKAAVALIKKGGIYCRYAELANKISGQRASEYSGILNRQNLNKLLQLMAK